MSIRIKKKDPEKPHLYFFQSATNHIRTIPIQQTSKFDPEDIDTDLEDHCIAEGELVLTKNGNIPIEQVKIGDEVLTRYGWKSVIDWWVTSYNAKTLLISTECCTIRCTPNHKIWTENRGFVRADSLTIGDRLLWLKEHSLMGTPIEDTQIVKTPVIGTTLSGVPKILFYTYIGKCGNSTMGKFLKVVISTIKTVIRPITPLKIWNVLTQKNIAQNIHILKNVNKNRKNILLELDTSQKNGTLQKKGISGTFKMVQSLIKTMPLSRIYVFNVEKHFLIKKLGVSANSAQIIANPHGEGQAVLITKSEFVPTAEMSSSSTNTVKLNAVVAPVLSVLDTGDKYTVYDITVEDTHEFFVNGLLVHNCIDALRYLVARKNFTMKRGGVRM